VKRAAALLAVALVALPLAGCGGGGDSDTYVLDVTGTAEVRSTGPVQHLGSGKHRLEVGWTVTVTRGSAVLGLPGDATLELRDGRRSSVVKVGPRPTLLDGDALAVASDGDDVQLSSGGASFAVHDGAARVRRAAGVTLAVYAGKADVESLGERMEAVPALRQVTVSNSGALPSMAVPLVYDRAKPDRWDVRYLNGAIDLGGVLDRGVRVLNARSAPPDFGVAYLREVLPAMRTAKTVTDEDLTGGRSVGETIVGASIALGGRGDVRARWKDAFDFRDAGADWGLVALDQQAKRASVLDVLNGVIDRVVSTASPLVGVGGGGGAKASSSTSTTAGRKSSTTPTTSAGRGTTSPTTPTLPTIPPLTVPFLPSSPTPTVPPTTTPTTPTRPTSPTTTPRVTTPRVTIPPPVKGLLDGLLGGSKDDRDGLLGGFGRNDDDQGSGRARGYVRRSGGDDRPTGRARRAVASTGWPTTSRSAQTTSPASSSRPRSAASTSTRSGRSWPRSPRR
jgi:hypothetical protein